MASTATRTVGKAVAQRVSGSRPGALTALAAAVVVGVGAGVAAYRLLRSGR
jgi:hypothetical protein